jgi:hypothetical protein
MMPDELEIQTWQMLGVTLVAVEDLIAWIERAPELASSSGEPIRWELLRVLRRLTEK